MQILPSTFYSSPAQSISVQSCPVFQVSTGKYLPVLSSAITSPKLKIPIYILRICMNQPLQFSPPSPSLPHSIAPCSRPLSSFFLYFPSLPFLSFSSSPSFFHSIPYVNSYKSPIHPSILFIAAAEYQIESHQLQHLNSCC